MEMNFDTVNELIFLSLHRPERDWSRDQCVVLFELSMVMHRRRNSSDDKMMCNDQNNKQ